MHGGSRHEMRRVRQRLTPEQWMTVVVTVALALVGGCIVSKMSAYSAAWPP